MSLPTSLLTAAADHRCFTGCYRPDPSTLVCVDPKGPLAPALQAVCTQCLSFRVGALKSVLGVGMTPQGFADELSNHVCGSRGYVWSTSEYAASSGFWISAAYFGNGLFIVDASRNTHQCTDLDALIHAFRHGVVTPDDPRMLTSSLYTAEIVYLDMSQSVGPVLDKQSLLAAPGCRTTPMHGYQRASILEFIPMARSSLALRTSVIATAPAARPALAPAARSAIAPARASTPPAARPSTSATVASSSPPTVRSSSPATAAAPAASASCTDSCPRCGAEVKERPLFVGTYVGCLC
jgi:hypothetical protein